MLFMGWSVADLRACPEPEYLEILAAMERRARDAERSVGRR